MEAKIKQGEIKDITKEVLEWLKGIITPVELQLPEADLATGLQSIRDLTCLAVRPRTDETDQLLEDLMPERDIPSRSEVGALVDEVTPLTEEQRSYSLSYLITLKWLTSTSQDHAVF